MSNPVIILGAGASYDYSVHEKPAPLTKDLVKGDILNRDALKKYPDVAGLFSSITHAVLKKGKNFEIELQNIKNKFGNNFHRKEQFIALEFYLQELFKEISQKSHEINNYQALIDKIKDHNEGLAKACIVTFNYDTLLDKCIKPDGYDDINDYINSSLQLIKPHGSHDWVYVGDRDRLDYKWNEYKSDFDFYKKNPHYLNSLREKNAGPYTINQIVRNQVRSGSMAKFPAIAVPLQEKQELVCPLRHQTALKTSLQQADRLLIIGWRAADEYFLKLLEENIVKYIPITIVAESIESVAEIKKNLRKVAPINNFTLVSGGFTEFISGGESDEFFS